MKPCHGGRNHNIPRNLFSLQQYSPKPMSSSDSSSLSSFFSSSFFSSASPPPPPPPAGAAEVVAAAAAAPEPTLEIRAPMSLPEKERGRERGERGGREGRWVERKKVDGNRERWEGLKKGRRKGGRETGKQGLKEEGKKG